MPLPLRRLLNHLPLTQGGKGALYVRSSWRKPSPFEQWRTAPPYRPSPSIRSDHFSRGLKRQRFWRILFRAAMAAAALWLIWESAHGLALF